MNEYNFNLPTTWLSNGIESHLIRFDELLQICDAKSPIPIVRDVSTVHYFSEEITKILPRYFTGGLQVIIEHMNADS